MDIKKILQECKGLDREINANLELLERLKAREESCTAELSDMPRGTTKSDKTKITDKRIMLEEKLSPVVVRLYDKMDYAIDRINLLPDATQRVILTEYYLNNKTWEQVADKLNYSSKQIQRLHGYSLEYLRRCP